jgi:DNA-binding Lrp family transcriptional regulator
MDEIDARLIARLRENGRASVAELARALGLSRTTVQSRIARLEETKVIVGYSARLSEAFERGQIHAYVMITVRPKQAPAVVSALKKLPAVRLLHSVSGGFDLMAVAATASAVEMDDLIDQIGEIDGVERTTSSIVLSTKIDR